MVEAVRGRPIAMKHREIAQAIGLTFILMLMFFVFYQDIMRLLGPQ
jgi:regulator of sigma E protease